MYVLTHHGREFSKEKDVLRTKENLFYGFFSFLCGVVTKNDKTNTDLYKTQTRGHCVGATTRVKHPTFGHGLMF